MTGQTKSSKNTQQTNAWFVEVQMTSLKANAKAKENKRGRRSLQATQLAAKTNGKRWKHQNAFELDGPR
jgi:hypothetical protein